MSATMEKTVRELAVENPAALAPQRKGCGA